MAFRDNYTNFSFNDISSESMKVWLTNNREIEFKLTPNFNDTFVSPVTAQTRYHTATTYNGTDFTLNCIAINITQQEWRAIQGWLSPSHNGKLQFDFNDNTYYQVKISKPSVGKAFPIGSIDNVMGDIYNVEFTINCTTTGDWAALGPKVTVPVTGTYSDLSCPTFTVKYNDKDYNIIMNKTYSEIVDDPTLLLEGDVGTWDASTNNFDDDKGSLLASSEGFIDKLIIGLQEAITENPYISISSAINNKYGMPFVYNITASRNNTKPSKGKTEPNQTKGRVYITEPTVITNKTLYLDEDFVNKAITDENGNDPWENTIFYIFDNTLSADGPLPSDLDVSGFTATCIAQITRKTYYDPELKTESKQFVISANNVGIDSSGDYDMMSEVPLTKNGFSFFGVNAIITSNIDNGEGVIKGSPFYIKESPTTYALMNAGSYDAYPEIYIGLGAGNKVSIFKDKKLMYKYNLSIKNGSLLFKGKEGIATFNNAIAEGAVLHNSQLTTKVVTESENNGILSIPSGNPEILKIRVFGIANAYTKKVDDEGGTTKVPVGLTHIFFQPIGDFSYSRNNGFAAMLFDGFKKEQNFNKGIYPLVTREFLESSDFGSVVINPSFTTNGFIHKEKVTSDYFMWVLTMPTKDFTSEIIVDNQEEEYPYMYLSLCDYSELSIETEAGSTSYISMQTRDAF